MKAPIPRPFPAAVDHPRFFEWNERSYREDLRPYGVEFRLHHYTSFSGLISILESNRLWATDVRFLNDDTEIERGRKTCLEALMSIRERHLLPHVGAVVRGLEESFRHQIFVACFSRANNLEVQWKEYADEHKGFAIAFDSLCLSWLWSPPALRLMPVEYGPKAQQERADRAVRRALDDIAATRPESSIDFEFAAHSRFTLLAVELLYMCATFKGWQWRREQEWRLIYSRVPSRVDDSLPVLYRGRKTPYVELDLLATIDGQPRPVYAAIRQGAAVRHASDVVQRFLRERRMRIPLEIQAPFA